MAPIASKIDQSLLSTMLVSTWDSAASFESNFCQGNAATATKQ